MPVAHEQQVGEVSGEGPRLVKRRGKTHQEEVREPESLHAGNGGQLRPTGPSPSAL